MDQQTGDRRRNGFRRSGVGRLQCPQVCARRGLDCACGRIRARYGSDHRCGGWPPHHGSRADRQEPRHPQCLRRWRGPKSAPPSTGNVGRQAIAARPRAILPRHLKLPLGEQTGHRPSPEANGPPTQFLAFGHHGCFPRTCLGDTGVGTGRIRWCSHPGAGVARLKFGLASTRSDALPTTTSFRTTDSCHWAPDRRLAMKKTTAAWPEDGEDPTGRPVGRGGFSCMAARQPPGHLTRTVG